MRVLIYNVKKVIKKIIRDKFQLIKKVKELERKNRFLSKLLEWDEKVPDPFKTEINWFKELKKEDQEDLFNNDKEDKFQMKFLKEEMTKLWKELNNPERQKTGGKNACTD